MSYLCVRFQRLAAFFVFLFIASPVLAAVPPPVQPVVLPVSQIQVERAASTLRALFPRDAIRVDRDSGSLVVIASAEDVQAMRTILQGVDVRNPVTPTVEAISLQSKSAQSFVSILHPLFPHATFTAAGKQSLLVRASPGEQSEIKTLIAALDAPPPIVTQSVPAVQAVHVTQRSASDIARAVSAQLRDVRASISGSAVVLKGSQQEVESAKALIAQLDVPEAGARYAQMYRLRSFDARSVGDLLRRSYADIDVRIDMDINALSVTATAAEHQRIADSLAQLDGAGGGAAPTDASVGASEVEVVTLRSAIPAQGTQGAAQDATATLIQVLQQLIPSVHVVAFGHAGQIVLSGDSYSLRRAKEVLEQLDVPLPQVVLDTEIYELDEST